MKTAFDRIHHAGLVVSDLDTSLQFYERMFGAKPEFVGSVSGDSVAQAVGVPGANIRMAFLQFGGTQVELISYEEAGEKQFPLRNCDVGASHICFLVDDIRAAYEELKAKGAEFYAEPLKMEGGALDGCSFVCFRDPDGTTVELFEAAST